MRSSSFSFSLQHRLCSGFTVLGFRVEGSQFQLFLVQGKHMASKRSLLALFEASEKPSALNFKQALELIRLRMLS